MKSNSKNNTRSYIARYLTKL